MYFLISTLSCSYLITTFHVGSGRIDLQETVIPEIEQKQVE